MLATKNGMMQKKQNKIKQKINESTKQKTGLTKNSARRKAENPAKTKEWTNTLSTRDIQVISIITYLMIGMSKMEIAMRNSTAQIDCKCTMYITYIERRKMEQGLVEKL